MQPLHHHSQPPLARDGFLLALITLVGLGTIMVFSSTGFSRTLTLQTDFVTKHCCFLLLSGMGFLFVNHLSWRTIQRLTPWAFLALTLLLILVLIPGFGTKVNGARRWFRLGPVSWQPSEFMKLLLPLMLAWCSQKWKHQKWARRFIMPGLILLSTALITIQPDLGTSLVVLSMGACYLFLVGWPIWIFLAGFGGLIPAVGLMMHFRPYQWERMTSYLAALESWENAHYQVKQSLLSIGAGGYWGVGPGRGLQKLSFLPESHTDFVFAVIAEELGLVGTISVLGLWFTLLLCGSILIYRIRAHRIRFALASSLLFGILLQAIINMSVVTSLLPPKGISHPLLSYGGSNLLAMLLGFALILNTTTIISQDNLPHSTLTPNA